MGSLEDKKVLGTVFNVQKYSVHDGPGIRTIVFLKGCPLSCAWCSNPESQVRTPELAFNAGRCLSLNKCKRCVEICTRAAISANADQTIRIDRTLCADCTMPCAAACPSQGLLIYGKERSVDDILHTVEQDSAFYRRSGGGMTLSGGEPLLQKDFAIALLREARKRRIKTAIETCGMVPWSTFEEVAPYLSTVLFDIKHMDSAQHEKFTGRPNTKILENFANLCSTFPHIPVLARTPLIPGFNDTPESVRAIATYIKPFSQVNYEMLPYHRLGTQKYTFLNRTCAMDDVALSTKSLHDLSDLAREILGDRLVMPK
ncbi:MAG: glycyl-radical enzyme activating protein [Desulfovibrionaceae bacterium]